MQTRLETVRRRKEERLAELKRRSALEMKATPESPSGTPSKRHMKKTNTVLDRDQEQQEGAELGGQGVVLGDSDVLYQHRPRGFSLDVPYTDSDDMDLLEAIIAENKIPKHTASSSKNVKKTNGAKHPSGAKENNLGGMVSASSSSSNMILDSEANADTNCDSFMLSVMTQYQLKVHASASRSHRAELLQLVAHEKAVDEALRLENRGDSGKKNKSKAKKVKTKDVDASQDVNTPGEVSQSDSALTVPPTATPTAPVPSLVTLVTTTSGTLSCDGSETTASAGTGSYEPEVSVADAITSLRQTVQKIMSGNSSSSKSKKNKKKKTTSSGSGSGSGGDEHKEAVSQSQNAKAEERVADKKVTEAEDEEGTPTPTTFTPVDPPAARSFNYAMILKTLAIFLPLPSTESAGVNSVPATTRHAEALRSAFFTHGGIDLCCELLNTSTGMLMSAQTLDLDNPEQSQILTSLFAILQGALFSVPSTATTCAEAGRNADDGRLRADSVLSMTSTETPPPPSTSTSIEKESPVPQLNEDVCKPLFRSGLALHLIDTLHVLLLSLSVMLERTLLPAAMSVPSTRGSHTNSTSNSVSVSARSTPRKEESFTYDAMTSSSSSSVLKTPTRASKPSPRSRNTPTSAGAGTPWLSSEKPGPIQWPSFMFEMIFPLFTMYGHLCQYAQRISVRDNESPAATAGVGQGQGSNQRSGSISEGVLRWLLCVSSSGLLETTSTLFRQLQVF